MTAKEALARVLFILEYEMDGIDWDATTEKKRECYRNKAEKMMMFMGQYNKIIQEGEENEADL